MELTIKLNEEDVELLEKYAARNNISMPEAVRKAAHNMAYLDMLDQGIEQIKNGQGIEVTFEELEQFVNG